MSLRKDIKSDLNQIYTAQGSPLAPDVNEGLGDIIDSLSNSAGGDIASNGSVAFTANQSMGGNKLTNVADPVNPQDAATKNYVDTHGGAVIIASQTLSGSQATVTFSGIPQTFRNLKLVYYSAGSSDAATIQANINGDLGASYNWAEIEFSVNGVAGGGDPGSPNTYMYSGYITAAANTKAYGEITLPFYTDTTTFKKTLVRANQIGSTTHEDVGQWNSTSAVTSITLSLSAGNFLAGGQFILYGSN